VNEHRLEDVDGGPMITFVNLKEKEVTGKKLLA